MDRLEICDMRQKSVPSGGNRHHGALTDIFRRPGTGGFTLVELAIVMVIIGAIFMSVLQVESMVKSAKTRQLVNMYRELRTAIMVYKDKYGYLPGDDPFAVAHLGLPALSVNHYGDGNGRIGTASSQEVGFAQEHLSVAGLIKGQYNGKNGSGVYGQYPIQALIHPFSDITLIAYHAFTFGDLKSGNAIRFEMVPPDVAQAVDSQLDDGKYDSGFIRGVDVSQYSGWNINPFAYKTPVDVTQRPGLVMFFE
jgi:prepilin-type N-terminal cleavage/methylation domain-containing protein